MYSIDEYLDRAMENKNIPSNNKLATVIGISGTSLNAFRTKRSWPADNTMIKIAELAGVDVQQALLDLNMWRSSGPVRALYQNISDSLNGTKKAHL